MTSPNDRSRGGRSSRWGYVLAIVASAIGHVAVLVLILVVIPRIWRAPTPPVAYTVNLVGSIPAGDLGSHLPRLSQKEQATPVAQESEAPEPLATPPTEDHDNEAIALNTLHVTPTPTPRQTPRPRPTPRVTIVATPRPHKAHRMAVAPTPTATPTPRRTKHRPSAPAPKIVVAKAAPTPNLQEQLAKVRAQLRAEAAKRPLVRAAADEPDGSDSAEGDGPVVAPSASEGKGYGVGPGGGSAGILQDAGFLLYYQAVQKRIKDAWSFAGDNSDLTATVTFGINPDGTLNSIKVASSSRDPSFDDSVVRAIRRAAPFAPPPEKYRGQFSAGIDAVFKLSELTS